MPRSLHDVTKGLLIIVLSEVVLIISAQSSARPFRNGVNNQSGGHNQFLNQRSQTKNTTNGYHIDLDLGLCREGWVKGYMKNVPVCFKLNKAPLSWHHSRDQCRQDKAFLVKLETPVTIASRDIREYLQRRSIDKFWSGLHTENEHFVWDELAPHTARAYNDELESRLEMERMWQWAVSDRENEDKSEEKNGEKGNKSCGKISIPKIDGTKRKRSIRRSKRQAEDLIDNIEYPSHSLHNEGMPNHEFSHMMQSQGMDRNNINNPDIHATDANVDGIPGADLSHIIQSQGINRNVLDNNMLVTSSREIADPTIASVTDFNQNSKSKQQGFQQRIQAYIQSNGQKFQERLNERIQNTGMTQPQILQLLKQMQQSIRNSRDSLLDENNRSVDNHFKMPDVDRRPVSAISMINANTGRASTPVMHAPTGPNMKKLSDDFLKRTTNPVMGNLASDIDSPDMDTEHIMSLWNRRNPISKILKDKKNVSPTQIAFPKQEANSWIQKFRAKVGEPEVENVQTHIPLIEGTSDLDSETGFNALKISRLSSESDNNKNDRLKENQEDKQAKVKSATETEKERDGILENEWQSETRVIKETGPLPPPSDSLVTVIPPPLPIQSINQNLGNVTVATTPGPETTKKTLNLPPINTKEDVFSGINLNALFDEIIQDEIAKDKANLSTKSVEQQTLKPIISLAIAPEMLQTGERGKDDLTDDGDIADNGEVKTSSRTAAVESSIKNLNHVQKDIESDDEKLQLQVPSEAKLNNEPPPTVSIITEKGEVDLSQNLLAGEVSDYLTLSDEDNIINNNSTISDPEEERFLKEQFGAKVDLRINETMDATKNVNDAQQGIDDEIDVGIIYENDGDKIDHEKLLRNNTNPITISNAQDGQGEKQSPDNLMELLIPPTKDTVVLTDVVGGNDEEKSKDKLDSDEDKEEDLGETVTVIPDSVPTTTDDDELYSSEEVENEDNVNFSDDLEGSTIKFDNNVTMSITNGTLSVPSLIERSDKVISDRILSIEGIKQNETHLPTANMTAKPSTSAEAEAITESKDELHSSKEEDEVDDIVEIVKNDNFKKSDIVTEEPFTPDGKTEDNDEALDHYSEEKTDTEEKEIITDGSKLLTKVPIYEASSDYEFSESKLFTKTTNSKLYEDDSSSEMDLESKALSTTTSRKGTVVSNYDKDETVTEGRSSTEIVTEQDNENVEEIEGQFDHASTTVLPINVLVPTILSEKKIDNIEESNEKMEQTKNNINIIDKAEGNGENDEDGFSKDKERFVDKTDDDENLINFSMPLVITSSKRNLSIENKEWIIDSNNVKDESNEDSQDLDIKDKEESETSLSSTNKNNHKDNGPIENNRMTITAGKNNTVTSSENDIIPNRKANANQTSDDSVEEVENFEDTETSEELLDSKGTEMKENEETEPVISHTDDIEKDKETITFAYDDKDSEETTQEESESSEKVAEKNSTASFEENTLSDDISEEDTSSSNKRIKNSTNDNIGNENKRQSSEDTEMEKEEIDGEKNIDLLAYSIDHKISDDSKEDTAYVKESKSEEIEKEIEEKEDIRNINAVSYNTTNDNTDDSIENTDDFGQPMSEEIENEAVDENKKDGMSANDTNYSNEDIAYVEVDRSSIERKEYDVIGKNNSLHESNEVLQDDYYLDDASDNLEENHSHFETSINKQMDASEEYIAIKNTSIEIESTYHTDKIRKSLQEDEILNSPESKSEEAVEDQGWGENLEKLSTVKKETKRESGEQMEDFEYADENDSHLKSEAAVQDEYRQAEEQDLDPAGDSQYVNDDVEYEPKDGADTGREQDDDWNDETNANMKMFRKASMKMEGCENTLPSLCFNYPITAQKGASTCDTDWYGHVFMDRCYRAIKDIDRIPYLNYQYGSKLCQALGGRIAEMRDGFGGKFIMLTLLKSMREFNMEGEPPGVWVNSEPVGTSCTMLTRSGPLAVSCDTNNMAVTVCEKTATNPGLTLGHVSDHHQLSYSVYFNSDDANKELTCDINGHASELPTLWFKDGRLIDIRVKKRLDSVLPHQGGRPVSPLPAPAESPTSSLILGSVLKKSLQRSTDQFLTDDVFQGTYWCEVWDLKPFRRYSSTPYVVRFSDVVTMVGTVHLPFIRADDVILHNKIQKNVNTVRSVEFDLNFINSIILPSLRRTVPEIQELTTYAKEIIGTKPFTLKFHTYIKMSANYSMATEIMIFRTLRRFYREVVRNPEVLLKLPRKTPLHLIRSMNVRSTVSCPQTLLTDTITGHSATFPSSAIGMKVDSFEICGGERAGQAFCTGDFSSGAYWTDVHIWKSCGQSYPPPPNSVNFKDSDEVDDTDEKEDDDSNDYDTLVAPMTPEERLKELAEMKVGEDNVEGVMEETADITESVDDLKEMDVEYIAEIMRKTANTARIGKFVTAKAMRTVDRVLSMQHRNTIKSRKASQIIKNFEKIAEDAEIDDDSGHFRMVMSNIALDVYQLHRHRRPVLGFGAKAAQTRRMDSDFSPNRIFTIYDQHDMYKDVDVAIQLPPDLIDEATAGKRRLFMMVYKKGNLFQDDSIPINVSGKVSVDGEDDLKLINSYVISASLGGRKIQGLSNRVKTIYRPLINPDGRQRTCAFYDFAMNNLSGGWSSAGCVFNGTNNGREICLCDHLTNFAILIDFYGQRKPIEPEHEETLSIISLIGLSLSILGLSLTIISYLFFRKLRQGRAQQTLFNLAMAMLFSWVVFLVGIKQTYHYIGCLIVAVLLHYFILASFMWMLMEAFLQYLTFVKVLGTYVRRYTLKSVLVAWGLPAVPVISVLSIDYTMYKGGEHYCWMSLDAFYYAFAIPVGVIILCNLVVFVITVVSIYRRPAGLRSNQSKHKMAITNLQAAITSFVLLGLSWILGYFAISDARLPFHYAFTILNSLQGFFIFVIFVVRKKQVRDQWLIACCCKTPEQQKAQRSLSASASIPSTCSAKSTRSSSSTSSLQQRSRQDRSDSCQTTTSFISAEYDSIYALPYSKVSRDSLYYRKF